MTFRRFLLLAMLAALALCAVVGVLAVFVSRGDYLWQILGTAIDTAVATGLLLPLSFLIPRPKLRVGGFTGMAVILAAWLCILGAIWTADMSPYGLTEKLAESAMFVVFMGVPSAGVLLLLSFRQARSAVLTFVSGAALAWLLCEINVAFEFDWRDGERLIATGMTLYGMNTCAAALLVNIGCGDRRYFRWAGVLTAAVGLGIAIAYIWRDDYSDEFFAQLTAAIIIPAVVMAHINLILMARLRASQMWLAWVVGGFSILSGLAAMIVMVWPNLEARDDFLSRGSAAAAIVAACGSLALIVLAVLNRKTDAAAQSPGALEATTLELTCPRCHVRQSVSFGDSACKNCELQFSIKITEPRCAVCGYLLYRLTSSQCPECGATVRPGTGAPANTFPVDTAAP